MIKYRHIRDFYRRPYATIAYRRRPDGNVDAGISRPHPKCKEDFFTKKKGREAALMNLAEQGESYVEAVDLRILIDSLVQASVRKVQSITLGLGELAIVPGFGHAAHLDGIQFFHPDVGVIDAEEVYVPLD